MKNPIFSFCFFLAIIIFEGCTKTGPAGPAGNANVSNSIVYANAWILNTPGTMFSTQININSITQAILDKGAVAVYTTNNNGQSWRALPCSVTGLEYNFIISLGSLEIDISKTDGSTLSTNPGPLEFKVVCIAGSVIKSNPGLDLTNYQSVNKKLQLSN